MKNLFLWVGFPFLWHNTRYKQLKRERHWLMVSEVPVLCLLVLLFVETWSKISWQEVHDGVRASYLMVKPREGVEASVSPSEECPQWPNFPRLHFPKVSESSDNVISWESTQGALVLKHSWLVSGMGTQKDSRGGNRLVHVNSGALEKKIAIKRRYTDKK